MELVLDEDQELIAKTALDFVLEHSPVSRFRALRDAGVGPAWFRASVGSARISYRIRDLAAWLEARRTESVL